MVEVSSDFRSQISNIIADGNKPEAWKEYIDIVKNKVETLNEFKERKNNILNYMYKTAFKMLPETDQSLSYAELYIDYVMFKSLESLEDAEKMMSFARRRMRRFSVIHVASAQLELKKGNKDRAIQILQRAPSVGARPLAYLTVALRRIYEGKTILLDSELESTESADVVSPENGKEFSEDWTTSQYTGTFETNKEVSQSDTLEVQNALDLITRQNIQQISSSSAKAQLSQLEVKRELSLGSNSFAHIYQTPQQQHHNKEKGDYSTTKRTLSHYYSTPELRHNVGSVIKRSVRKFPLADLGPPRRVKINPNAKNQESADDDTGDSLASANPIFHSLTRPPALISSSGNSVSTKDKLFEPVGSQVLNNKLTHPITKNESNSHMSVPNSSLTFGCNADLGSCPKLSNETSNTGTNSYFERNQTKEKVAEENIIARSELPDAITHKQYEHAVARKLALHNDSSNVQKAFTYKLPDSNLAQNYVPPVVEDETWKKQQNQLKHQFGGANNLQSSVPHQTPSASVLTQDQSNGISNEKTIYVNNVPYKVLRLVGRGGSAKVYQVFDPTSNVIRALKVVNLMCSNDIVREGYKNEISLLKKLQHCDRVIKLFDSEYVEASEKLLAVLEFGETDLEKFISNNVKSQKELSPITVCYYWSQMVTAVHAMHQEGVIHSDLKPANFILVSGNVKLIDFGIANSLQQECTSVLKENRIGTPSYMSPEALIANNSTPQPRFKVGKRSDVWSLGCILYLMVYGHTPFQHVRNKMEAIINPAHIIPFPDKGDPALMDILKKCLNREVSQRPTTDEILMHPYLQKKTIGEKPAPNLQSKLSQLKADISVASPRTKQALIKSLKDFATGLE
ncbi:dual specificity protein kinase TTK-like isoform X2 [Physella acuta]|uniref:dual specificity protein kinase TTK-like isoform X2 n=1 Tax=Physella acuta TaxID=109671 RepID=UPI0027DC351C|nr:dual specificity protein kinase TTK-like isoform X2 [Physella acuta]